MKILLMAASVRKDSCNKKLADLIAKLGEQQKVEFISLDFADYQAPLYDANYEERSGLPEIVKNFIDHLKNTDGLVICSPEYNFTTPGTLKNLIDWVSRARPMPWVKYPIMLCAASPSLVGGHRGLLSTASLLQSCLNAYVYPPLFSLANAYAAFTSDGSLQDKRLEERLVKNIIGFINFILALRR